MINGFVCSAHIKFSICVLVITLHFIDVRFQKVHYNANVGQKLITYTFEKISEN